jgi:hypothetical protein
VSGSRAAAADAKGRLAHRAAVIGERRSLTKGWLNKMIWTILAVLVVLWLLGLLTSVGGAAIHLLLVIAVVVFLVDFFRGRSSSV